MQRGKRIWSPGDVLPDGVLGDRHHGDGRVRRKPVGLVVPGKKYLKKIPNCIVLLSRYFLLIFHLEA